MARGNFPGWILALVAILAIVAGNLRPVIGTQELVGDGEIGSWNIENDVDGSITVHCSYQLLNLGTVVLKTTQVWYRQWRINPNFDAVFTCDFEWDSPSGRRQQSIIIWAHDDPSSPLQTCFRCEWKVQHDGFYFQQTDGQFVREWVWWTPSSSRKY